MKVAFNRKNKRQHRGYISDIPLQTRMTDFKHFIVVEIDDSTVPPEWLEKRDTTVHLLLDRLMMGNGETIKMVPDENGDMVEVIEYDYFHEKGRSVWDDCPVITIDDVASDRSYE